MSDPESRRILVVDDDTDICDTLELILESNGYQCTSASNGLEALAALRDDPLPTVILLDLMMPGMNGEAFRAEQLGDPRLADIPVVVMTGDLRDVAVDALQIEGYLRKPIGLASLLEAIDAALARPGGAED